jgi:putative FmdB family regulatory protein
MPILNYTCENCGKEFAKIFFDIKDAPNRCPVCDSYSITELGEAFRYDPSILARFACEACDSCDSSGPCSSDNNRSVGPS